MRPLPIPDMLVATGLERVVIGEADPTRDDVRPCEYLVSASSMFPGRPCFYALVTLDEGERAAIAAGADIWLTLDGAEVPWSIDVASTEMVADGGAA